MSAVSLNELRTYINNYEASDEIDAQLEGYLASAQQIVEDYLGYKLEEKTYTRRYSGTDEWKLYLDVLPIKAVTSLTVNNEAIAVSEVGIEDDYIFSINGMNIFRRGVDNIVVGFTAGYSDEIADIIKTTILRIAALLWSEQDGNIGITSKTFSDGSRSFISYTNFNKYLQELRLYRGRCFK